MQASPETDATAPFFSIITITLNNLSGFRKTRVSIEGQSLSDFEWIVIDGASTDGTVAELKTCALPNFSYVSEKDGGIYNAMNKGLARARGCYVIFMNAADCFAANDVLEMTKARILSTGKNPHIVYGDGIEQDEDAKQFYKRARPAECLHYGMHTQHQAMLYSREALDGLRFDESFRIAGDYDLTCRVYLKQGGSLALDFPVCIFARGGISEKNADVGRAENWRVQRDVLRHSLRRRLATRAKYLVSAFARTRCQPLYNRVRYQHEYGTR